MFVGGVGYSPCSRRTLSQGSRDLRSGKHFLSPSPRRACGQVCHTLARFTGGGGFLARRQGKLTADVRIPYRARRDARAADILVTSKVTPHHMPLALGYASCPSCSYLWLASSGVIFQASYVHILALPAAGLTCAMMLHTSLPTTDAVPRQLLLLAWPCRRREL
jgi:hypothetical protein